MLEIDWIQWMKNYLQAHPAQQNNNKNIGKIKQLKCNSMYMFFILNYYNSF